MTSPKRTHSKAGLASSGESALGSLAALGTVVWLRQKGIQLDLTELATIFTLAPVASSFIFGTLRSWWKDIMTAFQRGSCGKD